MKTTMKSLAGPDTIRVILIAFENGVKACEINITDMTLRQVAEHTRLQEYQGRTWKSHTIKSFTFPDFDRGEEGERC